MAKFKSVSSKVDFVVLEKEILDYWEKQRILDKYLHKNDKSPKKFSFLDGPITANNPMGVHHAWGRTYKDIWQRFWNMKGYKERFRNGFDEQGLWVEVEVEKELGFKNKKDIEKFGIDKFVNLCKQRIKKFAAIQTEQSKRLGYFMDWNDSYHTSSDENNFAIWNFLKVVSEKGWLYKGRDSVPWCPRCGTAISQHEILTEEYQNITHDSVYIEYPIEGKKDEYLLVWTTTPWTLVGNVAIAVDPDLDYVVATGEVAGNKYYLSKESAKKLNLKIEKVIKGKELVGLQYESPFDELVNIKKEVIETNSLILPISEDEGTGLVHIAPGAGAEDFALCKEKNLAVVELIDEEAKYLSNLGQFSGQNAKNNPKLILDYLKEFKNGEFLFDIVKFTHKYPICWRCKQELVWRVVDEWYIAMDRPSHKASDGKQTYREQMIEVAKKINWLPKWGLDRELDWLKNMHDWLISKKRYWGLALPIWECSKCNNFEVIGSKTELKEKTAAGWDKFEGNSPHRPWIDEVKIKCNKCGGIASRILDVGNPWLDAGIVPFSTMPKEWFPANFITESFPGQFKNWFYSLIAMSTALKGITPVENLLGFASVVDDKGEPMHKSSKNFIPFDEGAEKMGVDIMRWMYAIQNPENNLPMTYEAGLDIKRRFILILWNSYKFFVDYANLANWFPKLARINLVKLDSWILARLNQVIILVNESLEKYDASTASRAIEDFVVSDFSTWYIRRSRDRKVDCLPVMYEVLVTLSKILAPFIPFLAEEMFKNLTNKESVHLQDYPLRNKSLLNEELVKQMKRVRELTEVGHSQRKVAEIKLRQPLQKFYYSGAEKLSKELEKILAEELNVKEVEFKQLQNVIGFIDTKITPKLREEGDARDLIRQIQQLRKDQNLTLADKTIIEVSHWPKDFEEYILKSTASVSISKGDNLVVKKN